MPMKTPYAGRSHGFSLIEVMVALIIITIGLLGIAKMEALAYSSTGVASMRSIAAIEASSLASAMHANRDYWANGLTPAVISVAGATVTDSTAILGANCASGTFPSCTNAQLAGYDLQNWANSLKAALPQATATVTCPPAVYPINCTITLTWIENTVAVNQQSASAGGAVTPTTYTLYVEP